MNTSNIKKYTPKVGLDFIAIMTKQAVMAKGCEPMEIQGCLDIEGGITIHFWTSISF